MPLLGTQMLWMWIEHVHDWQTSKQTLQQLKLNGERIKEGGIKTNEEDKVALQ